jgi:hypothetical protein
MPRASPSEGLTTCSVGPGVWGYPAVGAAAVAEGAALVTGTGVDVHRF